MPDVQWNVENMIQLVQEYKKLPELWNPEHDLYRVQSAKYEAWASLAELFSCDIVDIRKKLNSILASRRREKAKVREGSRSTWFLYPYLSFLHGHIEQPEFEMKMVQAMAAEDNEPPSDRDDDTDHYEEEVIVKEEPSPPRPRPSSSPTHHRHGKKRRKVVHRSPSPEQQQTIETQNLNLDLKMSEIIKLLRHNDTKKKDECDTFGEYIASSLRTHDDKTRSMIKQAINNILFEQEMKKYSAGAGSFAVILATEPADNPLADHTHTTTSAVSTVSTVSTVHIVEEDSDGTAAAPRRTEKTFH